MHTWSSSVQWIRVNCNLWFHSYSVVSYQMGRPLICTVDSRPINNNSSVNESRLISPRHIPPNGTSNSAPKVIICVYLSQIFILFYSKGPPEVTAYLSGTQLIWYANAYPPCRHNTDRVNKNFSPCSPPTRELITNFYEHLCVHHGGPEVFLVDVDGYQAMTLDNAKDLLLHTFPIAFNTAVY